MIVLTGPTGCGKSTTIYALIRELLREHQDPTSIITLEDPIEKVIGNISQVNVAAGKDEWTYEIALRAALRQDVKTLVVGEMRDRGVVQVVLDAALTGHRVITTYHAGDIPSVYARMLHQGFEPFLIAAAVTGVVTQRLIPGVDDKLVPAAALLEPDDAWREFVCTRPGLGQLRAHVADRPQADIRRRITALADQGRISEEQKSLLTEG
jgi:type II secretory ATPase GspE/PulE/Tfp pilus assembly ATPase PilB-like protein